jgi:hypothetical protein
VLDYPVSELSLSSIKTDKGESLNRGWIKEEGMSQIIVNEYMSIIEEISKM